MLILNIKQKRQRTYKVTLWRVHEIIVAVESNSIMYFSVCFCVSACVWVPRRVSVRASVFVCGCGFKSVGFFLRACRITYPVWYAQAPYSLRPVWLDHILRHYLINGTIFRKKKSLNMKYVFLFSVQLLFETFLILRRIQRLIVINVKTSLSKVPVVFVGF
jgi:hypothetical protein